MPQLNYDNSHSEGLITHTRERGSALIKRRDHPGHASRQLHNFGGSEKEGGGEEDVN